MAQRSDIGRHRKEPAAPLRRPIGRVGALAVALGVGVALSSGLSAAVAHAEDAPNTAESANAGGVDTATPVPGQTSGIGGEDDSERPSADPVAESTGEGEAADESAEELEPPDDAEPNRQRERSQERAPITGDAHEDDHGQDPVEGATTELSVTEPAPLEPVVELESTSAQPPLEVAPVPLHELGAAATLQAKLIPESAAVQDNSLAVIATSGAPAASNDPWGQVGAPLLWAALSFARREVAADSESATGAVSPVAARTVSLTATAPVGAVTSAAGAAPNLFEVVGTTVGRIINGIGTFISTALSNLVAGLQNIIARLFNAPPVARADGYSTMQDAALTVATGDGVLANDTDANGNPITARLVTGPSHGMLALNSDGSFTYTPTAGFGGADSFSYRADDGFAASGPATVTLTVTPVAQPNQPPVAVDDSYTTAEASTLVVPVGSGILANDTDDGTTPLAAQLVTGPSHGDVTLAADGSFTYTPDDNFSGTDFFTYSADDGAVTGNSATVSIVVTVPGGVPPVTTVGEPDQASGLVTGRVTVVSRTGNPVAYSLAAPIDPTLGTVTVDPATGQWTFTPNPQARLDANPAPAAAVFTRAAAATQQTVTFVIEATDGVNVVAVPVAAPIDPTTAATTATIELGAAPTDAAVIGDRLYVAAGGRVLVFDTATNAKMGEFQAGTNPTTLTAVGNKLYISESPPAGGNGTVRAYDTVTDTVVAVIPVGESPSDMQLVGSLLYVANVDNAGSPATVIDTLTDTVVGTAPVGIAPFGLAATDTRLFAANYVFGTVTVVDTTDNTQIDVDPSTPTIDPIVLTAPFTNPLVALAISGDQLYVANVGGNTVLVIDTTTYAKIGEIDVGATSLGVTAAGDRVYVGLSDGTVAVIDTSSNTVVDPVAVGAGPNRFAVGDGRIYVVNAQATTVSVITDTAL
ncbi:Ig-like domain-containing protein [Mycolicibacterium neoaurum]|uniref:Ig-like domain-containing protein n=1 Tax=Mycolicibacterium neoaurum TaxID=1795 RepID=UPI002670DF20|nr:Ig-like domain-containing protein [Mycolicibacterium neoaurum]MDO3403157.1 Ig-like domain-containing protein [Mycolicibacterium neoaurum]